MPQTWQHPTIQAQRLDFINRAYAPLLQVLDRIVYPNGNVLLTLARTFSINWQQRLIDCAYLLAPADEVIAVPRLEYGDVISAAGTFQPFDAYLAVGVSILEIDYQDHNCLLQAWDVLLYGEKICDVVWETEQGCQCNGLHYRSVYQAANVAAEQFVSRQQQHELDPVF